MTASVALGNRSIGLVSDSSYANLCYSASHDRDSNLLATTKGDHYDVRHLTPKLTRHNETHGLIQLDHATNLHNIQPDKA